MYILPRVLRARLIEIHEPNYHSISNPQNYLKSFSRFFSVVNPGNTNNKEPLSEEEKSRIEREKKERKIQYMREYYQKPENKERKRQRTREYYQKPENKERKSQRARERLQKPDNKEKKIQRDREYYQKPEKKERKSQYDREYSQRPEIKEKLKEKKNTPEYKDKRKVYTDAYNKRPEIKEKIKKRYHQSLGQLIERKKNIDPNYVYKPQKKLPHGDLKDKDTLKRFLDRIGVSLKIRELSEWYNVSSRQLQKKGGSVLFHHYGSIGFALKFAYPEYSWDMSRFPIRNKLAAQRWLKVLLEILLPQNAIEENCRDHPALKWEGLKSASQYDIYVPELRLALEYQGEQHYEDIPGSGFLPLIERQKKDADKMASSLKHGVTLVYIPYWWDEKIDSLSSTLHQYIPNIFPKTDSPPIPIELPLDHKAKRLKGVHHHSNKNIMHGYDLEVYEDEIDVEGWYMSEKLDGIRAYWDGKTFWSKNARIINVPEQFKKLPGFPLDGELWTGYGENDSFLTSLKRCCGRSRKTNLDWSQIKFCVFDAPDVKGTYEERHLFLKNNFTQYCNANISLVPIQKCEGKDHLEKELQEIVKKGGEGIMIYDPKLPYQTGRCKNVLKVKKYYESEITFLERSENSYHFNCIQDNGTKCSIKVSGGYYVRAPEVGSKIPVKHQGFFANSQRFKYPVLIEPKAFKPKTSSNNNNKNSE